MGIDLSGFDVKTSSGALNAVLSPFRGVLQNVVEGALEGAVTDLADTALSGSVTGIDTPTGCEPSVELATLRAEWQTLHISLFSLGWRWK